MKVPIKDEATLTVNTGRKSQWCYKKMDQISHVM